MSTKCPKCDFDNSASSRFCAECGTNLGSGQYVDDGLTETLANSANSLTPGSSFGGRYVIVEELGKGGMGRVYRAYDQKVHEEVALKLIRSEIAANPKTIERFKNELKIARRIVHRNVCRMFELMETDGIFFITMEYVPGENLKSFIKRSRELTIAAIVPIVKQVCDGLAEAHRLGFVHRDLKPSNIMIDKDGNAKLMDFGIARSVDVGEFTTMGNVAGTPEYMSPEQVEGSKLDPRSDIYSLGVVLYEMATGRLPFSGETPLSVAVKHKIETPPSPSRFKPQISSGLNRLIMKCLEKDKEKRYQDVGQLSADLDMLLGGGNEFEQKKGPEKKRKPVLPLVGGAVVILAALFVLFVVVPWKAVKPRESPQAPASVKPPQTEVKPPAVPVVMEPKPKAVIPIPVPGENDYQTLQAQAEELLDRGDLDGADRAVQAAKKVKPTFELGVLEQKVRTRINARNEQERKQAQEKLSLEARDDSAFEMARRLDTLAAYTDYLKAFPSGRNVVEANGRIAGLQAEGRKAAELVSGQTWTDPVTGIEFVWLPTGDFDMGSNSGEENEKPVHRVHIDGFWMGKYEVTQGQWTTVAGDNPAYFKSGSNYPVEQVSWIDVQRFIQRLNSLTGRTFRLPTEAEWEYAGRAGSSAERYGNVNEISWYLDNADNQTHPVGAKKPNVWGLYDILGNVWEWCRDWYGSYSSGSVSNPTGASTGSKRVFRGGSWHFPVQYIRAAYRDRYDPDFKNYRLGFRLARDK